MIFRKQAFPARYPLEMTIRPRSNLAGQGITHHIVKYKLGNIALRRLVARR